MAGASVDDIRRKRLWIAAACGIFGLVVAASLFTYADATNFAPSPLPPAIALALCPASLIGGYLFFDVNGHSIKGLICALFMTGVNALVYYAFGLLLARLVVRRKPHNSN